MVSIIICEVAIIVSIFVMNGFCDNITNLITSLNGHIRITKYSSKDLVMSMDDNPIGRENISQVKSEFSPFVQKTTAFAHKAVLLKSFTNEVEGIVLKGIENIAENKGISKYITGKSKLKCIKDRNVNEILISEQTACKLNTCVNDELLVCVVDNPLKCRKVRVVGIYSTYIPDLDDRFAFCDLKLVQKINNWSINEIGGYELTVYDIGKIDDLSKKIAKHLDGDLKLMNIRDDYGSIFDWLKAIHINITIFVVLVLIVTSANLISGVITNIMSKTSTIGILRSIGISCKQMWLILFYTNFFTLVKGMLIGNIVGIGLCAIQYHFKILHLDPACYYIDFVPISWKWTNLIILDLITLFITTIVIIVSIASILANKPITAIRVK